jgi:hypothetical protein
MVDRSATCTDESPSGDDFEWVNAWAESAVSGEPRDEPSSPTREAKISAVPAPTDPQPSDEVLTAAPVLAAPDEAPLVPATAIALVAAESIEPQSADDRIEAAEPLAVEDHIEAPACDDTTARAETSDTPPSEAPTWLERKPWARIFRIVARNADRAADHPVAVLPEEPADALSLAADEAEVARESPAAELVPIADNVELAPEHVELAPDQLERDITEIELIRDRLLAEEDASAVPFDEMRAAAPSRTSDHVPILVGGALAFTLLVVFGAAASLVSLR